MNTKFVPLVAGILALLVCPVFAQELDASRLSFSELEALRGIQLPRPSFGETDYIIRITDQQSFDHILDSLKSAVDKGADNIVVTLPERQLFYKNGLMDLSGLDRPELSVRIEGHNTILTGAGRDYAVKERSFDYPFHPTTKSSFLDDTLEEISLYDGIRQADGKVEVLDAGKKTCRIKSDIPDQDASDVYIQVTSWFRSYVCPVSRISDGYIYFTDWNLVMQNGEFSINQDYRFAGLFPRYRVFNLRDPSKPYVAGGKFRNVDSRSVHECSAGQFLVMKDSKLNYLGISGISFIGTNASGSLITLTESSFGLFELVDCSFRHFHNLALSAAGSRNISIFGNSFSGFQSGCLTVSNTCENVLIDNNVFENVGLGLDQVNGVYCYCNNYCISNNTFRDFGYAAIRIGAWLRKPQTRCFGIVENNEIYYTDSFYQEYWKHTLMDGGAIYLATYNDGSIVRYNYIHDYVGMKLNRGIFGDGGVCGVYIYGNVVRNVPNSYSIDCYRTAIADEYGSYPNDHNYIFNNVIYGPYKFQGRNGNVNACYGNVLVGPAAGGSVVSNIKEMGEDTIVSGTRPQQIRRQVRNTVGAEIYGKIRKWL